MRTLTFAAVALLTLGACGGRSSHVTPVDRNRITAAEIAKSNAANAYDAVERLRPAFLRTRGSQSLQNTDPPTPMIYVDGMRYGTLQTLSSVPTLGIVSIEYLSAIEATQRFGIGNEGGAIMITTQH